MHKAAASSRSTRHKSEASPPAVAVASCSSSSVTEARAPAFHLNPVQLQQLRERLTGGEGGFRAKSFGKFRQTLLLLLLLKPQTHLACMCVNALAKTSPATPSRMIFMYAFRGLTSLGGTTSSSRTPSSVSPTLQWP